jgi:hypothetical protein
MGLVLPSTARDARRHLKNLSVLNVGAGRGGVFERNYSNFTTTRPATNPKPAAPVANFDMASLLDMLFITVLLAST